MTKRDKIGVVVLIVILAALICAFIFASGPRPAKNYDFDRNFFTRQRMRNLEKGD